MARQHISAIRFDELPEHIAETVQEYLEYAFDEDLADGRWIAAQDVIDGISQYAESDLKAQESLDEYERFIKSNNYD